MTESSPRIAVVGTGAWGTTLAVLVGRSEPVVLLARSEEAASPIAEDRRSPHLSGIELGSAIRVTAVAAAVATADLVVIAVPSAHVRETVERVAPFIDPAAAVLSVVKGLEAGTLMRMTEVIAEAGGIDPDRIAALSGPNLALEIARGLPASGWWPRPRPPRLNVS
jgi:glycerol-3-phosphate dehydrogenase (NAD(P)+)